MFKVESPANCKIFLKQKTNSGIELKELMLTQVFNYKISENKRPVYGFNKKEFDQVVSGKRLFEGVIAIKKSIVSDIAKLVSIISTTDKSSIEYQKNKVKYLKNFLDENRRLKTLTEQYEDRIAEEYNQAINNLNDVPIDDALTTILPENNIELVIFFGNDKNKSNFEDNYKNFNDNYQVSEENLQEMIYENSDFLVESLNFYERSGEINIDKSDVMEIYKFFGKIKTR